MRDAQAIRFWTAFVALALLNIVGWSWMQTSVVEEQGQPLVRLVKSGGAGELGDNGRVPLFFDRDIFAESAVGTDLRHPPFSIEPATPGNWRVQARNQLTFETLAPPRPGMVYRVLPSDDHPIFSRYEMEVDTLKSIRFRPLDLQSCRLIDVDDGGGTDDDRDHQFEIELRFNQDVAPEDLLEALTLEANLKTIESELQTRETTTTHRIRAQAPLSATIRCRLAGTLAGVGGTLTLEEDEQHDFKMPRGLEAGQLWPQMSSFGQGRLYLPFNSRLKSEQDLSGITISPEVANMSARTRYHGINILGDFEPNTRYTVTLQPPLIATNGKTLRSAVTRSCVTGERDSEIRFTHGNGMLGAKGALGLDLEHVNVNRARLKIHRLPERNVPLYLGGLTSARDLQRLGEPMADLDLELDPLGRTGPIKSLLELETHIGRRPGIYLVSISSDRISYWRQPSRIVMIGDLGLTLQRDRHGLLAWTTSIETGEPVPAARVIAWSPNREQLISVTTDENGLARLPLGADVDTDLVTATLDETMAYLNPREATGIDDRTLGGAPWVTDLVTSLYPDRGVHRPGETILLTGLLRDSDGGSLPEMPLEIRLTRPDGEVVLRKSVTADNEQGLFHVALPTPASAPSGDWTVSCHLPERKESIGRLKCSVMPFIPTRLKVEAAFTESTKDDDKLRLTVDGTYLNGGPGSGLPVRLTARFSSHQYANGTYPNHVFERKQDHRDVHASGRQTLDERGHLDSSFDRPDQPGTWIAKVACSVRERGGRANTRTIWTVFDTAPEHLGIDIPSGRLHQPNRPIRADVVLLDSEGALDTSRPLNVELLAVDHEWVLYEKNGGYRWRSEERTHPVSGISTDLQAGSDGHRTLIVPGLERGSYRLVVRSSVETAIDFHVADDSSRGRMAAERPDRLELIPEGGPHRPGETTSILVRSAFPGTVLVTVETDRILATHVAKITEDGVRVPIRIPEEVRDTCFVGATVIRGVDAERTEWLPIRARGAARLQIDDSAHRLNTMITASDGARPGDTVRVRVAVEELVGQLDAGPVLPTAMVHCWAVEEGALLPTDFHVPNPIDGFFKDRSRVVTATDTHRSLLPDYLRPDMIARIGGDLAGGQRSPVPVRLRETEVIWQEHLPIPADGLIDLDLEMPDLDGAMRIMAVVVDDDRYGATEHTIAIAAPLEVVATLPRAAAPGDLMQIPVRVQNRTNQAMMTRLDLELDPILRAELERTEVNVPAMGEKTVTLMLEAQGIGPAKVRLQATPMRVDSEVPPRMLEQSIAIRPPHGRRTEVRRFSVPGGESFVIERNHDLEAFDGRVEVLISDTAVVDIADVIQGLIDYPYGCGEQTGSRLDGLLAAGRLPEESLGRDRLELEGMITAGIYHLQSMQRPDGGIGYWTGGSASPWVTIRSGLILQEARERGYAVPDSMMKGLTRSIRGIVNARSTDQPTMTAMALRYLAHVGDWMETHMQTLHADGAELPLEARLHLADAFHEVGLEEQGDELLETIAIPRSRPPTASNWFHSDLTDIALALEILLQRRPDHVLIPDLAARLIEARGDSGWRTTYEDAIAVGALVDWHLRTPAEGTSRGAVEIAGRRLQFGGEQPSRFVIDTNGHSPAAERVDNLGDGTAHVVVMTSGVPLNDTDGTEIARGMSIERSWTNARGEKILPGAPINAGDLITVEVSIRANAEGTIENVAIVEVLPGGMEFELPSLATSAAGDQVKLTEVDNVDFRDDRLIAFTSINQDPSIIRYLIRAVVPGEWTVPPPDALAMYDQNIKAHGIGHRVEIREP